MLHDLWAAGLAMGQDAFYVAAGPWPALSMRSFEAVTGPKQEDWLVKTFGILLAVVGGIIGRAGWRREVSRETALLGMGSAATLAGADVIYVARGRLRRVYLLDAAAGFGPGAGLAIVWWLSGTRTAADSSSASAGLGGAYRLTTAPSGKNMAPAG